MIIWELPQNIIGWLTVLITHARKKDDYYIARRLRNGWYGVSLGQYIIFTREPTIKAYKHEHGHQLQSRYLGSLYLLIIGIPSLIGNLIFRIRWVRRHFDYYKQPWEAWADELGGVNR